jgi:hypothetical protein
VDLLGDHLAEVAAWYGSTPTEFRSRLEQDASLRLDTSGRLYVEDTFAGPPPNTNTITNTNTTQRQQLASVLNGSLVPDSRTFFLHSRPGAERTVYLDFDGATIRNTVWNTEDNTGKKAVLKAVPFNLDRRAGFSSTELRTIQYIWQRVAEDFAPFDVDITTQAPAPDALTRSSQEDTVYGVTVGAAAAARTHTHTHTHTHTYTHEQLFINC